MLSSRTIVVIGLLMVHALPSRSSPRPELLTVSGPLGTATYTPRQLRRFLIPPTEGLAAVRDSAGAISPPRAYRGTDVAELLCQVGFPVDWDVVVSARDGRRVTFSYDQVWNHRFTSYDPITGVQVSAHIELLPTLVWERDGKRLGATKDGAPGFMILSREGVATDVEWSVPGVERMDVVPSPSHWSLGLHGALDEWITRATFESLASDRGKLWVDEASHVWSGVPLRNLVARVDDGFPQGKRAFNDSLAALGYVVAVVGADWRTALVNSTMLRDHDEILVANLEDGQPLAEADRPVRLVGPGLSAGARIGRVVNIVLYSPRGVGMPFGKYPEPAWR